MYLNGGNIWDIAADEYKHVYYTNNITGKTLLAYRRYYSCRCPLIFELLILRLGETCWEAPKDVDTFGSLVSLEDLNLNLNSITALPNSIGKCTRLKVIKAEVHVGGRHAYKSHH